jgi:hypothetical protein
MSKKFFFSISLIYLFRSVKAQVVKIRVRDKLFDRLITTNKGKLCSKLKELRVRHRTSEKLDINQITKN